MAERRMFAKTIIDSDAFLQMPATAQMLYFHLAMRADDDGFINNPKRIMRMIGSGEDDLKLLILKKFIIPFESGVVVIKHWKIHNYIRKDTYNETKYKQEKATLELDENSAYTQSFLCSSRTCDTSVDGSLTQDRIGKDRIGKDRLDNAGASRPRFTPPTIADVSQYCIQRGNTVDAQRWFDYYTSNGWMVGKNHMKDWKAAVRTWERGDNTRGPKKQAPASESAYTDQMQRYVKNLHKGGAQ